MKLIQLAVEKKREQMMKTAIKKGLTSNETIKLSQELDEMMNLFIPPHIEIKANSKSYKRSNN